MAAHGRAIMALGAGHAAWGLIAYRRELAELARSGLVNSVGDGIFNQEHARDDRAAATWFMFAAPTTALIGRLVSSAEDNADRQALATAGWAVLAFGAIGVTMIPRSGFWAGFPIGASLLRTASRLHTANRLPTTSRLPATS